MRYICLIVFQVLLGFTGLTQITCGTAVPSTPPVMDPAIMPQLKPMNVQLIVRVYIHVVDLDNGTLPEYMAKENNILDAFEFTRQALAPAGICLVLAGMDSIRDSEICIMNHEDPDDVNRLKTYVKPGYLNIFVHNLGFSDQNLLGTAYNIPNNFISLHRNWTWSGNKHLMVHEIGHALGLLHTFEEYYGREAVARDGNCSNCTTAGDLICDTNADIQSISSQFISGCGYTGSQTDSCGNTFNPPISNIMAYHRINDCLEFTPQQMDRMRFFLQADPKLTPLILSNSSYVITNSENHNSGRYQIVFRDFITITSPSYIITGNARWHYASREVTIGPGTTMSPGPDGFVVIRSYPCQ